MNMAIPLFNEQIKPALLEQLSKANDSILVVIAWFNDTDLFNLLLNKAKSSKISIKIILSEEYEGNDINSQLAFQDLLDANENIYIFKIPRDAVLVHHKFCIIDEKTLISGSYNWTFGANSNNLEDVFLCENDAKVCKPFINEFNRIFDQYCKPIIDSSNSKLKELFDTIRNSIEHGNLRLALNVDEVINNIKSNFLLKEELVYEIKESFDDFDYSVDINSSDELISKWWELLPYQWSNAFLVNYLKVPPLTIPDATSLRNLFTVLKSFKMPLQGVVNIDNFYGLKNLTFINSIKAEACKIKSLSGIENLKNITSLYLKSNNLTTMLEINELFNLEYVDLSNNQIESLSSLPKNKSITNFYFMNNPCSTLKGIENLKSLEMFICDPKFKDFPIEIERLTNMGLIMSIIKDNHGLPKSLSFIKK
jgi:hypothetical protein